jgi:uncharacterized protein YutE (UPF0331/DUF86 family)
LVKPEVVGKRIARAALRLDEAEALLSRPVEEFIADVQARDLASFYLFRAIQDCIDLAAHWVADEGWGSPDDAGSTFKVLADRKVIERDLAEQMRKAVGFRNLVAHEYDDSIDPFRLYKDSKNGIAALRQFLAVVASAAGF